MISQITGEEFNNPNVCIRGSSHFACVCAACKKAMEPRLMIFVKWMKGEISDEEFRTAIKK